MAADPGGPLPALRARLLSQGITALSDEWLAACVDHVTQSSGAVPSPADLHRLVLDQWLDTDLSTLAVAALPPRLADHALVTLREPCAVQLLSAVDVSQPAHGQLLKLKRLDSENTEVGEPRTPWEPRASRALRLTLSDGVQQVTALECEPLPDLRADSPAGLKLLLRPPLECRRGVLLLAARSVTVLGGAVEELQDPRAEVRALEERIRAAGGLPVGSPDEDSGYRSDQATGDRPVAEPDPFDDGLDERELAAIPDIPDDEFDDAELDALEMQGDDGGVEDVAAVAATPFDDADDVDDAELASLDLDSLVDSAVDRVVTPEPVAAPVKRRRTDTSSAGGPPAPQRRTSHTLNGETNSSNSSSGHGKAPQRQQRLDGFLRSGALSASQASKPAPSPKPLQSHHISSGTASPVRTAPSFDLSSWLDPNDPEPRPEAPFGYLCDLQPGQVITVKAFIMTMLNSLDLSGGVWRLEVKINDGTRSTPAVLSDAVLTDIIGLTVAEAEGLKTSGRTDVSARSRLRAAIFNAQTAIIRLSCLMRLEAPADTEKPPMVTRLTEVSDGTLQALRACVDAG